MPLVPALRSFTGAAAAAVVEDGAEHDGAVDPLVELARRDPHAAARFVHAVMVFGVVIGVGVSTASGVFLAAYWESCALCERPLRLWLLGHCVLQLLQVPVRLMFLARLRHAGGEAVCIHACIVSTTGSFAWRASKIVSLLTYSWLVLGVIWAMSVENCGDCPGIFMLTIATIVQASARVLVAVGLFRMLFGRSALQDVASEQDEASEEMKGTDAAVIAALPVLLFEDDCAAPQCGETCSVCLSDYVPGEQLRSLPCGHVFHRRCADCWLQRSSRCPLCMGDVRAATRFKGSRPWAERQKTQ